MNIGQIKVLSWASAALLTLGLSFYVYSFVSHLKTKSAPIDTKKMQAVLEASEPAKAKNEDLVAYDDIRVLFHPSCEKCKTDPNCRHLNWTGKEKVVAKAESNNDAPPAPTRIAVKELVRILLVKVDLAGAKES